MAQLPQPIDATLIEPAKPLDIIPAGEYPAKMTKSEMKPTKAGDGSICATEFTILSGEYAGRKLFDNWNLVNPNQTAMEIAYQQLSAVCHAVGVFKVSDTVALHDKPLTIIVGVQPASGQYAARNDVKGYKALDSATSAGAVVSGDAHPPWAAQPPAAAAPAPSVPAAAAPVPAQPVKEMTDKAGGASYADFVANGWTDEQMVTEGYLVLKAPMPNAPSAVPAQASKPPWEK